MYFSDKQPPTSNSKLGLILCSHCCMSIAICLSLCFKSSSLGPQLGKQTLSGTLLVLAADEKRVHNKLHTALKEFPSEEIHNLLFTFHSPKQWMTKVHDHSNSREIGKYKSAGKKNQNYLLNRINDYQTLSCQTLLSNFHSSSQGQGQLGLSDYSMCILMFLSLLWNYF